MTSPNPIPNREQNGDPLSDLAASLERELNGSTLAPRASMPPPSAPRPGVGTSPGGFAKAGAGGPMWGPSSPHALASQTPLQAMQSAAETTYALHALAEDLLLKVTGEKRQNPLGPRPAHKVPLLPQITALATEIEVVLNETGRLLDHLRKQIA